MSMATRTETRSPELHGADNHEIIRVHGVREDMISLPADHVDLLDRPLPTVLKEARSFR